jgi:hypothetical protein
LILYNVYSNNADTQLLGFIKKNRAKRKNTARKRHRTLGTFVFFFADTQANTKKTKEPNFCPRTQRLK